MKGKMRRINIFGGAGCGKTTLATWLFSELTIHNLRIHYIDEWVKLLACEGKIPKKWDQTHIWEQQKQKEYSFLMSGKIDIIISDSPLLLVCAYCRIYGHDLVDELATLSHKFDHDFPSLNFFLDRTGIPYRTDGRFQTYEEALADDKKIQDTLDTYIPEQYEIVKTRDRHIILEKILNKVKL